MPARRRGAKRTSTSRTSELENKLDDLVSILRATASADQTVNSTSVIGSSACSTDRADKPESAEHQLQERDLAEFRERHLPFFPLIEFPRGTTAVQLQQEKPMLCMAIQVLSTKSHAKQVVLAKGLRETLAQKISAEGERSIDLLQSVLVCIVW